MKGMANSVAPDETACYDPESVLACIGLYGNRVKIKSKVYESRSSYK